MYRVRVPLLTTNSDFGRSIWHWFCTVNFNRTLSLCLLTSITLSFGLSYRLYRHYLQEISKTNMEQCRWIELTASVKGFSPIARYRHKRRKAQVSRSSWTFREFFFSETSSWEQTLNIYLSGPTTKWRFGDRKSMQTPATLRQMADPPYRTFQYLIAYNYHCFVRSIAVI